MLEQYSDTNLNEELFPDGKVCRIMFDNVQLKWRILFRDRFQFEQLYEAFSVPNPAAFFTSIYGYNTNKNFYLVNNFGFFDVGFIFEIFRYLKIKFGSLDVVAMSRPAKAFMRTFLLPLKGFSDSHDKIAFSVSNISSKYQLRDYQTAAIKSIIFDGFGRGLLELPTGSGKSFIIANFIYTMLQQIDSTYKTLIFVPNKQLVEQFYKDLIDYGFNKEDLGKLTGGMKKKEENPNAKIIIGNRQFLFSNKNKLPKIDILVCDEVHSIAPNSNSFDFVEKIDCKIKIGCSGTLPKDKYSKFKLIGLFSRIFHTEDIVKLQNEGYLSKLNITLLNIIDQKIEADRNILFHTRSKIHYTEESDIAFNDAYNAEIDYIIHNYEKLYSPILEHARSLKGNTLILFDRIEFGKNMYEYAKEINLRPAEKIFYIDGQTPVDIREQVRQGFESSTDNVLFAQVSIFSQGINIKNLTNLVMFASSKSASRTIQSIGRTLRKHESKDKATVIDCVFNFKYSQKHFKERLKLYKEFYNKSKPDKIIDISV